MKSRARFLCTHALSLLLCVCLAGAQTTELGPVESAQGQAQYVFALQELDQMLAPIALYPDSLLPQILMASTYLIELDGGQIVERLLQALPVREVESSTAIPLCRNHKNKSSPGRTT